MTTFAALDLRRDRYLAWSSSLTVDGFWVANGSHEVLDTDVDDAGLGAALRRMLAASHTGVANPHVGAAASPFAPMLATLGLRAYSTYVKGTRHVDVEADGGTLVVTPSRNGGSREGFVGLPDRAVRLTAPEPAALGAALRAALTRSV
ncbi:hypothetical protein [Micromonospora cathayae]|uniref:Uncharacterized protein n=1 Tax=Micromonospora cathayae TaxID=3028804 RepID=A0ABY7ZWV5_9ACTN|nr:hypothetical protein [Micromonospora sp. HUAS 3]WDZ87373.1 hypothetical protein PVK37_13645 [Micromonospora sp. HUAS 3]